MRRRACQNQGIPGTIKIIKILVNPLSLNGTRVALKIILMYHLCMTIKGAKLPKLYCNYLHAILNILHAFRTCNTYLLIYNFLVFYNTFLLS
jgi:hypothetical protein